MGHDLRGNAVQHWHRPAQDLRPPDFSGPGALKERMAWRVAFNADAEQARSGILNGKVDPKSPSVADVRRLPAQGPQLLRHSNFETIASADMASQSRGEHVADGQTPANAAHGGHARFCYPEVQLRSQRAARPSPGRRCGRETASTESMATISSTM